jgi:large subunit ribosomal protein L7Ae
MASYVDIETPADLVPPILDMLSASKDSGTLKKGVNETTKSIERKSAKFVVVATDVSPEEIVVHIPMLCKENGIPYAFVPTAKELGGCIGISKGTTSIAVENPGSAGEKLQDILKRMPKPGAAKPAPKAEAPVKEEPKKEKPKEAPKKEAPKEEKKPEPKKEEKPKAEKKPEPKKEEAPKEEKKEEKPAPKEEKKEEPKPKEEVPKEEKKE